MLWHTHTHTQTQQQQKTWHNLTCELPELDSPVSPSLGHTGVCDKVIDNTSYINGIKLDLFSVKENHKRYELEESNAMTNLKGSLSLAI